MARLKVVAIGSTAFLLVAAVTWSAIPRRASSPSLSVPPGSEMEPSDGPHVGQAVVPKRSGGTSSTSSPSPSSSLLAKVFALVVPAAKTEPTPLSLHPARAQRVEGRWTVVSVPVDRAPVAALPAKTPAPVAEPVVDTDADWYADAPDEGPATKTYAQANPGRVRGVPRRLPVRDAGNADWYDSLGSREASAPAGGTSIDALVASTQDRRVVSRDARGSSGMRATLDSHVVRDASSAACDSDTTRYKLVKLTPSAAPANERLSLAKPLTRGLPAPHDDEPAIVVASLGPRLPGAGTVAYPGLAEPLPESTPRPVAFCPLGSVEKKNRSERWCTRADRGGMAFREGPVSFLYSNGKKRAQGTYDDGILQGPYVEYATNGRMTAEGAYRDGKKTGVWTAWWDNGKKQSHGPYVAGERSGVWTYFDEKGRKISQGELRTVANVEKKQGRWTYWHANGTKSQEGTFREGRKDGAWKSFDEKGRQVSALLWREGEEQ